MSAAPDAGSEPAEGAEHERPLHAIGDAGVGHEAEPGERRRLGRGGRRGLRGDVSVRGVRDRRRDQRDEEAECPRDSHHRFTSDLFEVI